MEKVESCPEELSQQSPFSDGVVANDELLIYLIFDPDHWNKGEFTNAAFAKSVLKKGTLSVCRVAFASADLIKEYVIWPLMNSEAGRKSGRKFYCALTAICSDLRQLTIESTDCRAICVIDDGKKDYRAHAHLSFSEPAKLVNKNKSMAIRAELQKSFKSTYANLEEIFNPR